LRTSQQSNAGWRKRTPSARCAHRPDGIFQRQPGSRNHYGEVFFDCPRPGPGVTGFPPPHSSLRRCSKPPFALLFSLSWTSWMDFQFMAMVPQPIRMFIASNSVT
jgi:hypothetical protein